MTAAYCYPGAKRIAAAAMLGGFSEDSDFGKGSVTDVAGVKWTVNELMIAVALAAQESSGNIWVVGATNPDGTHDYGTWQINDGAHKKKHPEWFGGREFNWANHVDNAKMAYAVYAEANHKFQPWVGYNTKRWLGWFDQGKGETYLAWADKGIKAVKSEVSASRPLEVVASIYLENLPLVR